MPPPVRRRIGPVDTIWLNMDRPNNLMIIESLMFLEAVPDWDEVAELIRSRVVEPFPVFHQRPESVAGSSGSPTGWTTRTSPSTGTFGGSPCRRRATTARSSAHIEG